MQNTFIKPDWPVSQKIHAFTTTRSINLKDLDFPNEPIWLKQVHGNNVICANTAKAGIQADAAYATSPNVVCAVLTADCLPILVCDRDGTAVAAIHAGWRSMANG